MKLSETVVVLAKLRAAQDAFKQTVRDILRDHPSGEDPTEELFNLAAGEAMGIGIGAGWPLEAIIERMRQIHASVENLRRIMGA